MNKGPSARKSGAPGRTHREVAGLQPRGSRGAEAGSGKAGASRLCRAVMLGEEFGTLVLGSGAARKLVSKGKFSQTCCSGESANTLRQTTAR